MTARWSSEFEFDKMIAGHLKLREGKVEQTDSEKL